LRMKNPWILLTLVVACFCAAVLPPIFTGVSRTYAWEDQERFHVPQINYFIAHPFDLLEYPASSASMPGHHLLMAWFSILLGKTSVNQGVIPLRLLNASFGPALLILVWVTLRRVSGNSVTATALTLPLAGSYYVITASIWVVTDNGALFFYAAVLFIMLFRRDDPLLAGVLTTLLVLWRQIYLPVAAAFLAPLFLPDRSRRAILVALSSTLAPALAVGVHAWMWGGLVPHHLQGHHRVAINLAVPLHALALTGMLALPYAPFAASFFARPHGLRSNKTIILLAAGIGLVLWLATTSVYDKEAGRWGSWIWYFTRCTPSSGGKAPLVLVLASLGALALLIMAVHCVRYRYFPSELLVLVCYFAGYSSQPLAWQRYIEPHILLTLGVFCSRLGERRLVYLAGPVLLFVVFYACSLARVYGFLPRMLG